MTGAILFETRPAMIIRSDWRGEPRKTSAPNRAISYREALIDIISMAQQAKPNDMGQMEFLRAQLTARSNVVNTIPSDAAAAALSTERSSIRANNSAGPLAKGLSIPSVSHGPPRSCKLEVIPHAFRHIRAVTRRRRRPLRDRAGILGYLGPVSPDHAGSQASDSSRQGFRRP